jgi:hypothetical protein
METSPSDNTCTYKGRKYPLIDIQLSTHIHAGFLLPGMNAEAFGELILTFGSGSFGVVLCLPIYVGSPYRADYLTSVLHGIDPSHSDSVNPPTLQSLFAPAEHEQTAFGYVTCYETIGDAPTTHSLYVSVFPHGISVTPADAEALRSRLTPYRVPIPVRGPEPTLHTYTLNQNGQKEVTTTSSHGELYTTPLSSCSTEFRTTIEYCGVSPTLVQGGRVMKTSSCASDPSKPSNYKCVPMEQLRDAKGQYIKLGSKTLETILAEQKDVQTEAGITTTPGEEKTTELVLEIVGTGLVLGAIGMGCYYIWKVTE